MVLAPHVMVATPCPASVTVDDSVTSSASGARAHLFVVSDGSEGLSVVVKRFRKRPIPEHD